MFPSPTFRIVLIAAICLWGSLSAGAVRQEPPQDWRALQQQRELRQSRTHYILALPKGHDPKKKYEVIVAIHGMGQPAWSYAQVWQPWAQLRNAIVVAPESADQQGYNWNPGEAVNIVTEACEDAVKNFGGDPRRVLLQGFSVGCAVGFLVMSQRPDLFSCYGGMGYRIPEWVNPKDLEKAAAKVALYYAVCTGDPNCPPDAFAGHVKTLQEMKFKLATDAPEGGHTITREMIENMYKHFDATAKEDPKPLEKAKRLLQSRKWGEAEKALEAAGEGRGPKAVEAKNLLIQLRQEADQKLEAARAQSGASQMEALKKFQKEYAGMPQAEEARRLIEELSK